MPLDHGRCVILNLTIKILHHVPIYMTILTQMKLHKLVNDPFTNINIWSEILFIRKLSNI